MCALRHPPVSPLGSRLGGLAVGLFGRLASGPALQPQCRGAVVGGRHGVRSRPRSTAAPPAGQAEGGHGRCRHKPKAALHPNTGLDVQLAVAECCGCREAPQLLWSHVMFSPTTTTVHPPPRGCRLCGQWRFGLPLAASGEEAPEPQDEKQTHMGWPYGKGCGSTLSPTRMGLGETENRSAFPCQGMGNAPGAPSVAPS